MGSVREVKETQEEADEWYKNIDKGENEKLKQIKADYLEFWGVKLALLVASIFLIPYLRDLYQGKIQQEEVFNNNQNDQ
jgi:hypothetical protein